jgi:hypothetical protein
MATDANPPPVSLDQMKAELTALRLAEHDRREAMKRLGRMMRDGEHAIVLEYPGDQSGFVLDSGGLAEQPIVYLNAGPRPQGA